MRIGFDTRMITHPGIGRYIKGLLSELILRKEEVFVLFGDQGKLKQFSDEKNVEIVNWTAPIYSVVEQYFPPYDKYGLDIVHIPHFNVPLFCRTKMVVTIHDLIYLLFPGSAPSFPAKRYARFMIGKSLSRADAVISVSENTKKDLISSFGHKHSNKISVVYEGASDEFRVIEDTVKKTRLKEKYALGDRIILYIGSVKPHKNVGTLIKMYQELKKRGIPHQLVIAGRWDSKEDDLRKFIDSNNVVYLDDVSSSDIVLLYNIAEVLVHLSVYEGFGLTVLEAMQCGTPVIVSEASSIPEVVGKAGITVDPLDVGQISDTVYNMIRNTDIKKDMIDRGLRRSAQFSWEKSALETFAEYKRVLS